MPETLQDRVRTVIGQVAASQANFADLIGMTKDKLSKALAGKRRFTSLELALVAEAGGVTVDWLLTGKAPARPRVAARRESGVLAAVPVPDLVERCAGAYEVLDLLYADDPVPGATTHAVDPRLKVGADDGVRLAEAATTLLAQRGVPAMHELTLSQLIDAVESVFGIDVAIERLPEGLDGLAWQTDGHRLCALGSTRMWTRQRFTLAHEVGHLLALHAQNLLVDERLAPARAAEPSEVVANRFAAAFLMPAREVRSLVRGNVDRSAFARLVVAFRVSPSAMAVRLKVLNLIDADQLAQLRSLTSVACHEIAGATAEYARQVNEAMAQRLPSRLVAALFAAYAEGRTTLRPLAGLLNADVDLLHDSLVGDQSGADRPESPHDEDLAYAL
jgi:Zn-dependent peptidase ImmA (M78 family)/transcriptional regulator with XRE-family HTH domain